jgi:hypothetical protein
LIEIEQAALALDQRSLDGGAVRKTPTINQSFDIIDILLLQLSPCIPVCISGRIPDFRCTTSG